MDVPVYTGRRARDQLIADLRHRICQPEAQIERLNDQSQQAQHASKGQAAPFAKGPPRPEAKRPGRKPGSDYGLRPIGSQEPKAVGAGEKAPATRRVPGEHRGGLQQRQMVGGGIT